MPYRTTTAKPCTLASAILRLVDLHGDSPATWETRVSGERSVYRRVAQINAVLREMGLGVKLDELMGPIEASIAARAQPDAQHREAVTDAEEDLLQEAYRVTPCAETARALIHRRSQMRAASLDDDQRIAALHSLSL
jgi:hypothetical protein